MIVVYFDLILGPSFVKEMRNVSIAVGRDATIDCHVSNAEDYKVIIFHLELLLNFDCKSLKKNMILYYFKSFIIEFSYKIIALL